MKRTKKIYVSLAALTLAALACSSPGISSAEPAGFPDLNSFAEVPTGPYVVAGSRGLSSISFSTADGINCNFGNPPNPNGQNQLVTCDGPLPGLQDVPSTGSGACDIGSVNQYSIGHFKKDCKDSKPTHKLLNQGQKISYGNVTCAVGDGPLIACIERVSPERGFVLQPPGSFVF